MLLTKDENIVRMHTKLVLESLLDSTGHKELLKDIISDNYISYHSINVCRYSTQIALGLGLSEEEIKLVSLGAFLHDVGKLEIPRKILYKPSELTDEEYNIIKNHTIYGYKRLKNLGFSEEIAGIARDHHEKLNGKGYMTGTTEVNKYTQIVSVADIFSALTEQRPYHEPYKLRDATSIATAETGINTQYLDVLLSKILR